MMDGVKSACLALATLAVAVSVLAGPVMAAKGDVVYECDFPAKDRRGGGWVSPKVFVVYNAAAGTAQVLDGVIQHFVGKPIAGEMTDETSRRISFVWNVKAKDPQNQPAPMRYTLTYYKDGQPAKMLVEPGGYDNRFSGSGTCKLGQT